MKNERRASQEKLKDILREMGEVLLAFSGGVDSTYLARIAQDVLGDKFLAVTATSLLYPDWEREEACRLAKLIQCRHRLIRSDELEAEGFAANPPNRCYICKKTFFSELLELAKEEGFKYVVDGANADDLKDYRPGLQAAKELGVRHPLQEAGLTKEDIRALSRELGLPTWDKASFACLASRFPYGTHIDEKKLSQVNQGEGLLRKLGFQQFRLRHHGDLARIEVPPSQFDLLLREAAIINERLKKAGFLYVTMDLGGYRMGSMNDTLKG